MDPIADFLTIIRNSYLAHKNETTASYSKMKHQIANLLKDNGYIKDVTVIEDKNPAKQKLAITFKYISGHPSITKIRRVSRPSVKVYSKNSKLPNTLAGKGLTIISTSKGLMSGKQARKANLGGEVICQIY